MKTLELLPYICYGRKKDSVMDSVTDCYAIQEQSPSISKEVIKLFLEHIKGSIQWEISEEKTKYADCFLIWRVNHSGFLFTKLSDGGCDSFNRNHSMQMDAVYLTNEQVPNIAQHKALFFASLCFSSVWEDWEKFKRLQPVDEHEPKVAEIAEKLLELFSETALSVHSLFLASHQYFTQREVDRIVYNDNVHHDKDLLKPKYATVKTEPVHVFVSSSEYPLPSTFSLIKYVPFIIIVVLILSIAGISWTAWHWENKVRIVQADYDLLHAEYVETKTLLTDEKAETTELKKNLLERMNEFNNTKNIINKQLQQIQEKDSRIEKLEDDITKLKTELQDSRKNADESLKKENELLNSENEKLNKKVNQIRQYIEEIHKIVRNELLPEK